MHKNKNKNKLLKLKLKKILNLFYNLLKIIKF